VLWFVSLLVSLQIITILNSLCGFFPIKIPTENHVTAETECNRIRQNKTQKKYAQKFAALYSNQLSI
jgi:hypothetical protein